SLERISRRRVLEQGVEGSHVRAAQQFNAARDAQRLKQGNREAIRRFKIRCRSAASDQVVCLLEQRVLREEVRFTLLRRLYLLDRLGGGVRQRKARTPARPATPQVVLREYFVLLTIVDESHALLLLCA